MSDPRDDFPGLRKVEGAEPPADYECIKCKYRSGDDWIQCNGVCPVKGSPHYDPEWENRQRKRMTAGLADTMTNSKPWAAHWLGGDTKTGATEVRPERFEKALASMWEAAHHLGYASHELAVYTTEIE